MWWIVFVTFVVAYTIAGLSIVASDFSKNSLDAKGYVIAARTAKTPITIAVCAMIVLWPLALLASRNARSRRK